MRMQIRIKDLRLRTIIGVEEWEREHRQDVIVNITMDFDGSQAAASDDLADTIDYKTLEYKVIQEVENADFYLLEKLAHRILELTMEAERVKRATVEVDKPHALRFADSISVTCSGERKE